MYLTVILKVTGNLANIVENFYDEFYRALRNKICIQAPFFADNLNCVAISNMSQNVQILKYWQMCWLWIVMTRKFAKISTSIFLLTEWKKKKHKMLIQKPWIKPWCWTQTKRKSERGTWQWFL